MIFEDHSSHGPDDPVAKVIMAVDCHPGQVESIKAFLSGVTAQAGVYAVELEHALIEKVEAAVEIVDAAVESLTGEDHGEQPLQPSNPDGAGEDIGRQGGDATEGRTTEVGAEYLGAEVAGTAGASAEGTQSRDS